MRKHLASWFNDDKNGLTEEPVGALDKVLSCPSLQQRVRPEESQFPFPLLWQREGEAGILWGTEEKVFSRGCQTPIPNHWHLKHSSAFQNALSKSTTCSLLLCQLTSPLLFTFLSKPCASPLSFLPFLQMTATTVTKENWHFCSSFKKKQNPERNH